MVQARVLGIALSFAVLFAACEEVSHENIERWRNTQKGPDKLKRALGNEALAPELRAHAAQKLIELDALSDVRDLLGSMPESQRAPLVAALVPRLWADARLSDSMAQPSPLQASAKDALFEVRSLADPPTAAAIDAHLVEWLTGGYYEGRARSGRIGGKHIARAIGPAIGPGLIEAANSILPADAAGKLLPIGDELLVGLAASGDPKAVEWVLKVVMVDRDDKTLAGRAVGALFEAYVQPKGFAQANARALKPHKDVLLAYATDERLGARVNNDAIMLLAAVGMPECLEPFLQILQHRPADPARARSLLWAGVQQGIRCGGAEAIVPVAEALPAGGECERGLLEKYFWAEVRQTATRLEVADAAETLLQARSAVARVSGVELLGGLALPDRARADARRIRQLAADGAVLKGYWKAEKRKDPTVGSVASEVAKRLEEVARGRQTK